MRRATNVAAVLWLGVAMTGLGPIAGADGVAPTAAAGLLPGAPVPGQPLELPASTGTDLGEDPFVPSAVRLTPDHRTLVYAATQSRSGPASLHSVRLDTGAVTQLTDATTDGAVHQLHGWEISPDGRWVVYVAETAAAQFELFSVPVDGGPPARLSQQLSPTGTVADFWRERLVLPDSSRVVFSGDEDGDGVWSLYSVPIGGGAAKTLSLNHPVNDVPEPIVFSAARSRLLYELDRGPNVQGAIFSVAIDGGPVVNLTDQTGVFGRVALVAGETLAMIGNPGTGYWTIPVEGGQATRLTPPMATPRGIDQAELSPNREYLVYTADPFTTDVFNLFAVPVTAGGPVQLNAQLPLFGDVSLFSISPDSSDVVYEVDQYVDEHDVVFSAPIVGGDAVMLNEPASQGNDHSMIGITPDSGTVVFTEHAGPDDDVIHAASVGGGSPVRLTPPRDDARLVGTPVLAGDGAHVIYTMGELAPGLPEASELLSVVVQGGVPTKLSGLVPDDELIHRFLVTPDGGRVVYTTGEVRRWDDGDDFNYVDFAPHMYSVPVGGGTLVELNRPLDPGVYIDDDWRVPPALVADSGHIIYAESRWDDNVPAETSPVERLSVFVVDVGWRCGGEFSTLSGTAGDDVIVGTAGRDVIAGLGGDDVVKGKAGDDVLCGGSGDDELFGGQGRDRLFGRTGRDALVGGTGGDELSGGPGRDVLRGRRGGDEVKGGSGGDELFGGPGRDRLAGNRGSDVLRGKRGDDALDGGGGDDECYGGPGSDSAVRCETTAGVPWLRS